MNKEKTMTHAEILQGLVSAGMKDRYGDELKPKQINANTMVCSSVPARMFLEMKQIESAGYVDYYLMAFWIFNFHAKSVGIEVWARGAAPSSMVCYCLGLTEVDPIKYGLHSARFVNEKPPKFQFDIEASRFDDFMKGAEDLLQANAKNYDTPAIRECLFKDVKPYEYLSRKQERPLPENLDEELARYALYFPQTMDLYEAYIRNPKGNLLIYQEQMLDILRQVFHVGGIKANQIRLSIQRGEAEQVEAYRQELFADLEDITPAKARKAWQRLTSNPRAFLKAHAVSRVLAKYKYEMK